MAIQAWIVPNRSTVLEECAAAEEAAERARRFRHRSNVLLKTGRESPILALRTLVLSELGIRALEVEPKTYES